MHVPEESKYRIPLLVRRSSRVGCFCKNLKIIMSAEGVHWIR